MSNIKEIIDKLPTVFNAKEAEGVNAVFQYEMIGPTPEACYVIVNNGTFEVKEGKHPSPTVTLKLDNETYKAMANKQLSGIQAYLTGKLQVIGNIMMAQKFQKIFPL